MEVWGVEPQSYLPELLPDLQPLDKVLSEPSEQIRDDRNNFERVSVNLPPPTFFGFYAGKEQTRLPDYGRFPN